MMRYLLPFILLIFISACDRQVIIDLGTPPHRLALSCTLDADSFITVFVNKSVSSLDKYGPIAVTHAHVYLYEDDILLDTMNHGYAGYYKFNIKPQAGKSYSIGCVYEQFDSIYAHTSLPYPIAIIEARMDTNAFMSENQEKVNLKITFSDPGYESNYYLIKLFYRDSVNDYNYDEHITSSDPLFDEGDFLAFDDLTFNGKTRTISFTMSKPDFQFQQVNHFVFELHHLNYDAYRFVRTFEHYMNNYNNPFSEPVQVFSNVSSKMGQFSGRAVTVKSLTP